MRLDRILNLLLAYYDWALETDTFKMRGSTIAAEDDVREERLGTRLRVSKENCTTK